MKKIDELRKKAQALPDEPGVYIMKDASGEIIYIGKAKVLKNRVSQYFGSQNKHPSKVRRMVECVDDFDYIIVTSEFEALVLECNLIKQHMPKYNILLKDDKGYSYIKVTDNGWKSIEAVFQKDDDSAEYIGPYTSSEYVSSAVKEASDIFMLPHCSKIFPKDIRKNGKPCLNYHIKLCSGACCGKISREENDKNVEEALNFILGNKNEIITRYKNEMNAAAENLEFEKAGKLRDKIRSIEKISQKQHVVALRCRNQDVFGFVSIGTKSCINVLTVRDGRIISTENFVFDRLDKNDEECIQILANYYSERADYPDRICMDFDFSDKKFFGDYVSELAGHKVELCAPKGGEGATLLAMAEKNATEKLSRILSYNDKKKAVLYELQELLGLSSYPSVIEAYDISNTNGSENVAGMVVFVDGKPAKKNYRRFIIKSFEGQDDYRSLAEVLNRRIGEYQINKDSSEGFGIKPDLILLDGGEGQVNAVKEIFAQRNFDVPLFGMVKDGKHRTRAITGEGQEISINDKRSVFTFVSEIQEEVHRYAISYHHKLKEKNTLVSKLTEIPGIGEKRARNLILKFRNIENISNADIKELAQVPGINEQQAQIIYNFFKIRQT